MSLFASPSFLSRAFALHLALASFGLSLASCASPGVEADEDDGASTDEDSTARDAGKSTKDAGSPTKSTKDAGTTKPSVPTTIKDSGTADAGAESMSDAGANPLGDLGNIASTIDWDALLGSDGGLTTPPEPPGPAAADNPKECPETAPENPIGSCIGVPVYATCKYGNYTCLCDWIHWLCI